MTTNPTTFINFAVAFEEFSDVCRETAAAMEAALTPLTNTLETMVIAKEWKRAHPGRRLPGGHTNARIQKKRSKALWEWWNARY